MPNRPPGPCSDGKTNGNTKPAGFSTEYCQPYNKRLPALNSRGRGEDIDAAALARHLSSLRQHRTGNDVARFPRGRTRHSKHLAASPLKPLSSDISNSTSEPLVMRRRPTRARSPLSKVAITSSPMAPAQDSDEAGLRRGAGLIIRPSGSDHKKAPSTPLLLDSRDEPLAGNVHRRARRPLPKVVMPAGFMNSNSGDGKPLPSRQRAQRSRCASISSSSDDVLESSSSEDMLDMPPSEDVTEIDELPAECAHRSARTSRRPISNLVTPSGSSQSNSGDGKPLPSRQRPRRFRCVIMSSLSADVLENIDWEVAPGRIRSTDGNGAPDSES